MKKLTEYAHNAIDEVQAVFEVLKTRNPGAPDEAVATLASCAVAMVYETGEEVLED